MYKDQLKRIGQNPIQAEYHKLDFDDLKEGEYQLHIVGTDLNSRRQASSGIAIHLSE